MSTIKKNNLCVLLLSMLFMTSFSVYAGHVRECLQYNPNDHLQDVTIAYFHIEVGSFNKCVGNSEWENEFQNPYSLGVRNLLRNTTSLRNRLDEKLTELARSKVSEAIAGEASLESASVRVTGPINVILKGQPDSGGILQLDIGGFGIDGTVRIKKNWYAKGKVTLSASNLIFSAVYNTRTGSVTILSPSNNHFYTDVDLSSPLAFLSPSLFAFLRVAEEQLEDVGEAAIKYSLEETASDYRHTLFSLDKEIPTGAFIWQGEDYGTKVKDQVTDFVEDVNVSISQYGKTIDNAYANVNIQNIKLTVGRKKFKSKFESCLPRCELP